jgi:hypothetical protein
MSKINHLLHDEEVYRVILASAGGIATLFTQLDIILKVLVAAATLFYICLKIKKELKNENK